VVKSRDRRQCNHLDEVATRSEGGGRAESALQISFVELGGCDGLVELRKDTARLVDRLEPLLHVS
jgi:hypothetical protein